LIDFFIFSIFDKAKQHSRTHIGVEVFMKNDYIVSPLYDFAFAEIFGNQRNIDNTIGFLKTLLDIPEDDYDRLTVVNPILGRLFRKHKMGVVDLKLNTKSGRIIHIELQVDKTANMRNRILYYICRLVGDQLNWGDDYDKLHQVVSIVICGHNMLEEETSYITEYELRNKQNRSFTKLLKLVILELPKLPEADDSAVWRWLYFLKCEKKEEFEMLAIRYPDMEKPIYCAKKLSLFEKWRDIRFHENLWKVDKRMRELQVRMDGHAEGKLEVARNALQKGLSLETVQEITGLDLEAIKKLQSPL
jgi:predicted transposase/invertase (TIGR01784 family)